MDKIVSVTESLQDNDIQENLEISTIENDSSLEEYESDMSENTSEQYSGDELENETDMISSDDETPTENGLIRVFYTNADNLMNKLDELRVRSYDTNYDIIVIYNRSVS